MEFTIQVILNFSSSSQIPGESLGSSKSAEVGPEWGTSLWIRYGIFFPIFLATFIGNLMVIIVVVRVQKLHSPSNYLIASLAFTDFLTSCFLPHEFLFIGVSSVWPFSPLMCQLRYASVILCCIASTHHLLAIAIDRYLLVTNVFYSQTRQPKKIFYIIIFVWVESILISLSPVFGWHNPKFFDLIYTSACFVVISQSLETFVGFVAFYIPFTIITVLYWRIYVVVRNRVKRKVQTLKIQNNSTTTEKIESSLDVEIEVTEVIESDKHLESKSSEFNETEQNKVTMDPREKRTALTLLLVTGVFAVCWGPWYTMESTRHWYGLNPNSGVRTLFYWITVCNSTANPIIYTIFIPSFREGFKQLFSCCFQCKVISTFRNR